MRERHVDGLLSVSWVKHHRRSAELAAAMNVTPHFIRGSSRLLLMRYAQQWVATWRLLRATRPAAILVMQPPPFALLCASVYARRHGTRIIGDLHTGVFEDPRWKWSTHLVLRILRNRGIAVVPNSSLAERCRAAGVEAIVSHGYLQIFQPIDHRGLPQEVTDAGRFVLVPLAFAYDEPVQEILDAARATAHLTWVLTGKAPHGVRRSAPNNIIFTGFVSNESFAALRARAAVVLAATTAEDTMQSAGYEALAAGTPLVTSPTQVLLDYFEDAALYAQPRAEAIAEMVARAYDDNEHFGMRMKKLRAKRMEEQDEAIDSIVRWLKT